MCMDGLLVSIADWVLAYLATCLARSARRPPCPQDVKDLICFTNTSVMVMRAGEADAAAGTARLWEEHAAQGARGEAAGQVTPGDRPHHIQWRDL